jgi:hypothetical protein
MRKLIYVLTISASLPLVAACTKSVESERRDVKRTHDQAAQEVQREQRELEETKQDAAERIARQERRVQDEAREGQREIRDEQRELQDAQRRETGRNSDDITPIAPPINP